MTQTMAGAETVILLRRIWTTHYLPEKAQGRPCTPAVRAQTQTHKHNAAHDIQCDTFKQDINKM